MQFETKRNRTLWTALVLGIVPDIAIATVLATVFSNGWFLTFLAALIGLQIFYLLIWAKNSIWAWVMFSFFGGRKKLASWIFDYLRESRYPEPSTYEKSAEGYLATVAESEGMPIPVRLKAASELGALKLLESSGQVQWGMRMSLAYEDALERYKQTFPQKLPDTTA